MLDAADPRTVLDGLDQRRQAVGDGRLDLLRGRAERRQQAVDDVRNTWVRRGEERAQLANKQNHGLANAIVH